MDQKTAYARALAAAFASDLSSPEIAHVVQKGGLTKSQFTRIVNRDIAAGLSRKHGPALFPAVRAFARQVVDIAAIEKAKAAGMSDISTIGGIGSLAGAIAGAVGAIWGAKINSDAQKNLAKIQLQEAQILQNSQSIAAKSALIQNATAAGLRADPATGQPIDPSTGQPLLPGASPLTVVGPAAQASGPGLPTWGIAAGIMAALTGGFFALKG
jgi:hypothetical protein